MPDPDLQYNLYEGLQVRWTGGKFVATEKYLATGLTGSNALERIMHAMTLTEHGTTHTGANLPVYGTVRVERGVVFYCDDISAVPWGEADADITVSWTTNSAVAGFAAPIKEVGSTVEMLLTDFDITNIKKPFAQRTPIKVTYNGTAYGGRVPRFASKSTRVYTNEQTTDPEPEADKFVSCVNSNTFGSDPPGTLLCLSLTGRYSGDGIWTRRVEIARDQAGFKQFARAIDPDTGQPFPLSNADVAASNGISEETVQDSANFNDLNLPARSIDFPGWTMRPV